jgi:hypothetical protein
MWTEDDWVWPAPDVPPPKYTLGEGVWKRLVFKATEKLPRERQLLMRRLAQRNGIPMDHGELVQMCDAYDEHLIDAKLYSLRVKKKN